MVLDHIVKRAGKRCTACLMELVEVLVLTLVTELYVSSLIINLRVDMNEFVTVSLVKLGLSSDTVIAFKNAARNIIQLARFCKS